MSLAELDARQPEIMANMQAAQEALGTIGSQITNLQTLPERAQASMSRAYQRSQEIRTRLNAGDGVSSAEKMKLNAELALLDLQLANLQRSWTTAPACRIWWSSNGTTRVPVSPVKSRNCRHCRSRAAPSAWGHREDRRRDRRTGGRRRQPLVQKEQELNHQLSQQLISSTNSLNTLAQKNLQAKSMLERGPDRAQPQRTGADAQGQPAALAHPLSALPAAGSGPSTLVKNLEEQIADLHLAQFELSQQRDQLFQKNQYLDNLIASSGETVSDEDRASLAKLIDTRIGLLDQLNRQMDAQLTNAISLQLTQQQLTRVYASIEFTLQQHIFWVSSNKPIDAKWFITWPAQASSRPPTGC